MYIMKLKPSFKDYLWGGTKLRDKYGMDCSLNPVAEAWVLSCHKDGNSTVTNGEYAGLALNEAIEKSGASVLGTSCEKFAFFPILIKLIDAKQNLSIQVHPSDDYAMKHENEFGKTEMWYVVNCEPDSYLYYGFKEKISTEEFETRINNNTLTEVLNKVKVKKGDCFFIESGTVHAIGAGLVIAEIQQNSNTTYRVYDYGRTGSDGRPRELHISKALDVAVTAPPKAPVLHNDGKEKTVLASCKYFKVSKYNINGELKLNAGSDSFVSLLCTEGSVAADGVTLNAGECAFVPAGYGCFNVTGIGTVVESKV